VADRPAYREMLSDPDLARLVSTTRQERLVSVRHLLTHLQGLTGRPDQADLERTVDIVWALISPEITLLLIDQRGWSTQEYGTWLGETILTLLLGSSGPSFDGPVPRGDHAGLLPSGPCPGPA